MRPVCSVSSSASAPPVGGLAVVGRPVGRISYCGFCSCRPCDVSSSLPNRMTRWCGWKTSFRNGWLNQIARSEPVAIAHQHLEDPEARPARRADAAADDLADDRGGDARAQRRDRLEVAAVLVADRKAVEQIFDGVQADALQVGGAARPDAFQELQRAIPEAGSHLHALDRCRPCTRSRISRMRGGQLERVVHADAGGVLRRLASSS